MGEWLLALVAYLAIGFVVARNSWQFFRSEGLPDEECAFFAVPIVFIWGFIIPFVLMILLFVSIARLIKMSIDY